MANKTVSPPSTNGTGPKPAPLDAVAMALANSQPAPRLTFRPAHRNRTRMIGGLSLLGVALLANLAVYRQLDSRHSVLQVTRDIPAGERITLDDLRVVKVSADSTVRKLDAVDEASVVGEYARVRIISGSLIVREALQPTPLVGVGSSVLAITIPNGQVPVGLRERSRVQIVVPATNGTPVLDPTTGLPIPAKIIEGRVVGLPTAPPGAVNVVSISLELAVADASVVAQADKVRIVLLDPGVDPATAPTAAVVVGG